MFQKMLQGGGGEAYTSAKVIGTVAGTYDVDINKLYVISGQFSSSHNPNETIITDGNELINEITQGENWGAYDIAVNTVVVKPKSDKLTVSSSTGRIYTFRIIELE